MSKYMQNNSGEIQSCGQVYSTELKFLGGQIIEFTSIILLYYPFIILLQGIWQS